jgi:anti-sigma regulatory factor (Ser/Thr protein kinase)
MSWTDTDTPLPDDHAHRPGRVTPYATMVRDFSELRRLRRELDTWLADLGAAEATRADLVLAVGEVVTNAIEASDAREARLKAEADAGLVRISVANAGESFLGPATSAGPREVLSERSRGLQIAEALTDSVTYAHDDGSTSITLTKRVTPHR